VARRRLAPLLLAMLAACMGAESSLAEGGVRFVDVSQQAGVAVRNWFGDDDTKTILETTGNGAAFYDADGDGDLDLYVVNGKVAIDVERYRRLPHDVSPPEDPSRVRNALLMNTGEGRFVDATQSTGTGYSGWGQGCVSADYDNDGDADLYVTNYGPNLLYRRRTDGTYDEAAAEAGVRGDEYSTAAAFADYDNDGDVDLFVGNYVELDLATSVLPGEGKWGMTRGIPSSPPPEAFAGQPDRLYRNEGEGAFVDVSAAAGLNATWGKALGAVFWDYDADGDQDLYVANDAMANFLYTNGGGGAFTEDALLQGVAYGEGGVVEGSMGVAAGDYDGDGRPDLLVANYEGQTSTLYHNEAGYFTDVSFPVGIGLQTLNALQWGALLFDYDNDGDSDVFLASGHITSALEDEYPQSSHGQTNQLFRNDGGQFAEVTAEAGEGLQIAKSSRGAAAGDYDGDGDVDVFVVNRNDTPSLLRNEGGNRNHWMELRLQGTRSNRDGIGAMIRVVCDGAIQTREVRTGSSYLSSHSLWVSFGLGQCGEAQQLEVRWPSGRVDTHGGLAADRVWNVVEGRGIGAGGDAVE